MHAVKEIPENDPDACRCEGCSKFYHIDYMYMAGDVWICHHCRMEYMKDYRGKLTFDLAIKVLKEDEYLS